MRLRIVMITFIDEGDVEQFDRDNRGESDAYFGAVLPETTTHFFCARDVQGDEYEWLLNKKYEEGSENGFELLFGEGDSVELRRAILASLLANDYAVCAWPDRLLFQPNEYRINRMVQVDLRRAVRSCRAVSATNVALLKSVIDALEDVRQ